MNDAPRDRERDQTDEEILIGEVSDQALEAAAGHRAAAAIVQTLESTAANCCKMD